ncbi:unnamed protein product [Ilex paraguariensis]|uniref:Uncharacterized protein n=1 Tax=Ilex paraguariensis TaxID=185542 RepID=A0ABC8T967_9AQUA
MADSSGTTLMDLITSDQPSSMSAPQASAPTAMTASFSSSSSSIAMSPAAKPLPSERKSKRGTLMQIQSDTISAAKTALNPVRTNIMPQRQKKKPVSYAQLARSIHELAATSDQKNSQKQLVHHVFPKLAVYNSVDPSLAPSLLMSDTISAAKTALNPVRTNIMPQRQKKKPVSYAQLARSIHELAATSDQKNSQKQLVHHVFPKLAVYNSVDPSLAPSLLMLDQQCEDRTVLRYVYYYLARILSDTGSQGLSPGGGIPTPNWDTLADIDAVGGVTRADVVPRIVDRLTSEALNDDVEFHARRLQALKALTNAPSSNSEILAKLYEIVFGILDKG